MLETENSPKFIAINLTKIHSFEYFNIWIHSFESLNILIHSIKFKIMLF